MSADADKRAGAPICARASSAEVEHLDGGRLLREPFECPDRDLALLEASFLVLEQVAAKPPGRRPIIGVGLPLGDQLEDQEHVSKADRVKLSRGRPSLPTPRESVMNKGLLSF